MQDQTHPDIAISVAKKSEEYACENCGECFRHWFAPMDHAIGHHHREYRVTAEARLQTMQQKPAKEKLETEELRKAIDEIYRYPLRQSAIDTLNRQLKTGISDERLVELVLALRDEDRLCIINEEAQTQEPIILCSLGLSA